MYIYMRFGRFGISVPLWVALSIGLPVTIIWLSFMLLVTWPGRIGAAAGRALGRTVNEILETARAGQLLRARKEMGDALFAKMEENLAEAAPGAQRDEMRYWWTMASEAYLRFLFDGRHDDDWTAFVKATAQIDELKRIHVGACPRCGTAGQLVGRKCAVCGQARVAFTPKGS